MLNVVVGHSNDPDSLEAVTEVLAQCHQSLAGELPQAGLLFAAIDFDHALVLHCIHQAFPDIELIGGTSDGEVSSVLGFQQDSLTLMLFCSDAIEMRAAVGRNIASNPIGIAQQTLDTAKGQLTRPLQFCLTLPESLTTSTTSILRGLEAASGGIPIFGGATASQWRAHGTYQFFKAEVLSDSVPLLLFAGNLALFLWGCGWMASDW